jgi:DNA-binding MarR family transcriptional regulator
MKYDSELGIDFGFAELIADFAELVDKEHVRSDNVSLSILQMRLLTTVYFSSESLSMRQLAAELKITMPSASVLCDRLEVNKYMLRKINTTDRRIIQAQLTAKGRDLVETQLQRLQSIMSQATAGYSEKELEIVHRFFARFIKAAKQA